MKVLPTCISQALHVEASKRIAQLETFFHTHLPLVICWFPRLPFVVLSVVELLLESQMALLLSMAIVTTYQKVHPTSTSQARARGAVSAETVSGEDSNLLQSILPPVLSKFFFLMSLVNHSRNRPSYDGVGEYSLDADTDDVAEGSNNLYHTAARVRAAVSVSSQADELIGYDSSNGSFSLRLQECAMNKV